MHVCWLGPSFSGRMGFLPHVTAFLDEPLSNPTNPVVSFDTSAGPIKAEIFMDQMPVTGSNFLDLVKNHFYDGQHFHRVIRGFMDQAGCPFSKHAHHPAAGTGGPSPGSKFTVMGGERKGMPIGTDILNQVSPDRESLEPQKSFG